LKWRVHMKDINGKKIPAFTETAILRMLAEKVMRRAPFNRRERRKIRARNSGNYRLFCNHDLDVQAALLDSLSNPISRF
jgi:hypothetical protein